MRFSMSKLVLPCVLALAGFSAFAFAQSGQGDQCTTKDGVVTTCPKNMSKGTATAGNDASMVSIQSPGGSTSSSWSFEAPKSDEGGGDAPPIDVPPPATYKYEWVRHVWYHVGEACHGRLPGDPGVPGDPGDMGTGTLPANCPAPTSRCGASSAGQRNPSVGYKCSYLECPGATSLGYMQSTYFICTKNKVS